jgi:uncharacterized membrane protein YheB (UPF0754 family)
VINQGILGIVQVIRQGISDLGVPFCSGMVNRLSVVILSVAAGAVIGFGTNLIAIIMLFRPWQEKRILGVRIPFTPGLIPKRQQEIAVKLGEVVEMHLLTEEGLLSSIQRPEWETEIRKQILLGIEGVLSHHQTAADVCRYVTGLPPEEVTERIEQWMRSPLFAGWEMKLLRDLLPVELQIQVSEKADEIVVNLLQQANNWLDTPAFRNYLASAIQDRLMGSGVLGRMAVLLVQEDKLVDEVLPHLKKWLESPAIRNFLQSKIQEEWQSLLDQPLGKLVKKTIGFLDHKVLVHQLMEVNLYALFQNHSESADRLLEKLLSRFRSSAPAWAPPLLKSIGIRRIVEEQAASFPVSRLEKIAVDVVRKELQMITWLGGILGGLIGLFQALFIVGWQ